MSNFETYQKIKRESTTAQEWAAKFEAPYYGGGGGMGRVVRCAFSQEENKKPTLYWQYSNGSHNYHACPTEFMPYLERAAKQLFASLLQTALDLQKTDLKEAAEKALQERKQIEQDAS